MLAPLENRALLEREPEENSPQERISELEGENIALRQALRQARASQKRMATLNSNRSIEQTNRISTLETCCENYRARIAELESGQPIIELGRQLMEARDANERLIAAAQRVWHLDKTICAAHRECERLARERDNLALRLCHQASDLAN
ncbi:hypothetical protein [Azonexus sp.]|uniref:hypothetical protein n=1 Tax=Azonexus sp. TaxID=1872668 RepID=UPI0027B9FB22|nr:hypothetical protein [Azonexus sp.]